MKRGFEARFTLPAALLLATAAGLVAGGGPAEPAAKAAPPSGDAAAARADAAPGGAGVRVYLDPVTGELRSRPPEGEEGREVRPTDWLNTYGADLVQEPLPGGGFKVDLRGRFQSSVVATIDPETDEVTVDCVTTATGPEAADER